MSTRIFTAPAVMTDDQIDAEFVRLAADAERWAPRLESLGSEMARRMGYR